MALEITGKLVQILDLQSGTSRNGNWQKQEFVIETEGQYPKKVCMNLWGEKADEIKKYSIGQSIKASINIESREYNGRWYTDVRAWKVEDANQAAISSEMPTAQLTETPVDPEFFNSLVNENKDDDDLPF
ncbi:MAG: DUF3127 domain-containing protein [Bacteroidales bacterium]|jgi:hypothetical protein|nr:DUF3127 domain-containing protein [Bacteroidales bacterium]